MSAADELRLRLRVVDDRIELRWSPGVQMVGVFAADEAADLEPQDGSMDRRHHITGGSFGRDSERLIEQKSLPLAKLPEGARYLRVCGIAYGPGTKVQSSSNIVRIPGEDDPAEGERWREPVRVATAGTALQDLSRDELEAERQRLQGELDELRSWRRELQEMAAER